jgi:16S rRNA (guanine966-N2)-methyltransferase
MSELVREALFNILGPLDGLSFLDAYAGSGAVGFEAASRGASKVDAVESNLGAIKAIRANIDRLDLAGDYNLSSSKIVQWLKSVLRHGPRYDIIFADPPYAELDPAVLSRLAQLLNDRGKMVVSHSSRIDPPELKSLKLIDSRRYGDSNLSFYRKTDE